jgi:hypothetical protein
MPNLHNRYISAERNISQKNPEYMLNHFWHNFGRGPSKNHFSKVWLRLAQ